MISIFWCYLFFFSSHKNFCLILNCWHSMKFEGEDLSGSFFFLFFKNWGEVWIYSFFLSLIYLYCVFFWYYSFLFSFFFKFWIHPKNWRNLCSAFSCCILDWLTTIILYRRKSKKFLDLDSWVFFLLQYLFFFFAVV